MQIVALVGIDGTGKSTQAKLLTAKLSAVGYRAKCVRPVFLIFNAWRLPEGDGLALATSPRMLRLRMNGSQGSKPRLGPPFTTIVRIIGYLYAVVSYLYLRILFRKEHFVVCDRYLYQYFYDIFGSNARGIALSFPRADLTFWLDGRVDSIRPRIKDPSLDRGEEYLESVSKVYQNLSHDLGFFRIDAHQDEESIRKAIWQTFMGEV